ncbi:uncharacterized protein BT62DRAFT_915582 [Guyanagaster necrorhizus]|uniref:Uncharacterized protein n=1 Tax=Guyanagaster necrorhizus TaxID=856835 RepID=A0A9P8AZ93_9AGAR|nr:uncharacterized protein BT62DRAFT_915582 [Guyanagaster necrorhizus MCA 3950]KAG7451732.1 hypothetical protein BT62DRAFT_915582 [Guyanagaster necrorhizus MCA 3950]
MKFDTLILLLSMSRSRCKSSMRQLERTPSSDSISEHKTWWIGEGAQRALKPSIPAASEPNPWAVPPKGLTQSLIPMIFQPEKKTYKVRVETSEKQQDMMLRSSSEEEKSLLLILDLAMLDPAPSSSNSQANLDIYNLCNSFLLKGDEGEMDNEDEEGPNNEGKEDPLSE